MVDLETRLRDLTARPPVAPTPVAQLRPRADHHRRRRTLVRVAVAATAVLVATGLTLGALGARGPADVPLVDSAPRPEPTTDPWAPGSAVMTPNTDNPNDEGYVSPRQLERAPTWLAEYDPAEVELVESQANGSAHVTGLVAMLEFRQACRTLKQAHDAAVANPGDPAVVHALMDPALARVDERTQFRGPSYFATLTDKLAAGDIAVVAAQFGPQGSCSRSLVIGSGEPPAG